MAGTSDNPASLAPAAASHRQLTRSDPPLLQLSAVGYPVDCIELASSCKRPGSKDVAGLEGIGFDLRNRYVPNSVPGVGSDEQRTPGSMCVVRWEEGPKVPYPMLAWLVRRFVHGPGSPLPLNVALGAAKRRSYERMGLPKLGAPQGDTRGITV